MFSSMKHARCWVVCAVSAVLSCAYVGLAPRPAEASVAIAVTYDALVNASSAIAVTTAIEQQQVWEGGRIYTYSRLHVDTAIAGELNAGDEAWVQTMGGVVGKVGQVVDGEPVFTVGRPSLVFLHRLASAPSSSFVVTARAQGQFGLYTDEQSRLRVRRSSAVGALVPPPQGTHSELAKDVLHGRLVDDVARDLATAWSRAHAR
jgi:hypothetical protein